MRVIINGAGIAGPTLAYWLRKAGHEVVLVEAARFFRGKVRNLRLLALSLAAALRYPARRVPPG